MTAPRIAAAIALAVLVWLAIDLLLLIFAGVLLATFLRTLAQWVRSLTGMRLGGALALVVLLLIGSLAGAIALYAPRVAEQTDELTQTLPQAFADLTSWARQYTWGEWLLDSLGDQAAASSDVAQRATRVAARVVDTVVGIIVILFVGVYLAAAPGPYLRGVLRLVPLHRRRRAAEMLFASGYVLRWWLVGQAVSMALVGLAMGIGLAFIGVPLALTLGVIAGLLEFIPYLGPLLGVGPALLLTLAESPDRAVYVLLLYAAVQTTEGYVVTPLVQRRVVHLPPVVTISAQVGLGWAVGALGLLLAVPLTAVTLVAVQMLYVKDALRDRLHVEAEAVARDEVRDSGLVDDVLDAAEDEPSRRRRAS